ncbi:MULTISPECIES: sulfur carrier protein ThiS [Clostridium]|uniref:Sulfur carrier protein n=1 Tax=Clostridium beijerinckii TaxID=1520 RepID=A0A1S8SMQ8_CLOBE|nr:MULTISPECIES: sulfur carrier protein ThiS [Clostridium]MBA8937120.1 sulfur carrier protein [Clostridium beijerinckii]MBN7572757.1 sulfur carrier protein ThiS [Clostridium beijerinckii]MBN7578097.1 sulfur carrier protein ThiS [Clostridium beijerinckii]MBN7582531.1 sulfur carrier protein ThiS [Clostridium beijerinckii]MBO0519658.1 sulfur carrier protein ThiS [Clostridium beijerinckii]
MVKVNGKEADNAIGLSLEDFLISEGYLIDKIVVELNGEIMPKSQYKQTNIKDGDSLEVISFVGGG